MDEHYVKILPNLSISFQSYSPKRLSVPQRVRHHKSAQILECSGYADLVLILSMCSYRWILPIGLIPLPLSSINVIDPAFFAAATEANPIVFEFGAAPRPGSKFEDF